MHLLVPVHLFLISILRLTINDISDKAPERFAADIVEVKLVLIGFPFEAYVAVSLFRLSVNDYFCKEFSQVNEEEENPEQFQLLPQVNALMVEQH